MLSVTWLAHMNNVPISYFSLANDSIRKKLIHPGDGESDYEYSHYPALKIARLAVHYEYERQGIGTAMLVESISIAFTIAKYAGCRIVTVDAKIEAVGFYKKYGFKKANTDKEADTVTMYLDLNKIT
jgi:ribosomal protein S18 acetylase RimI-like enzyme